MYKVSVSIITYEMKGMGVQFAKRCIESITNQTYSNIEILVSDHSINDDIMNLCKNYDVKYVRFEKLRGNSSANFNNAILNSSGDYIKLLCQDDCLYDSTSIEKIMNAIGDKKWLVSSYYTTSDFINMLYLYEPKLSYDTMNNSIGTPSCLTISKDVNLLFDENLLWFTDCEYYHRLHEKYSVPFLLKEGTAIQTLWQGQVTHTINDSIIQRETNYITNKYKQKE